MLLEYAIKTSEMKICALKGDCVSLFTKLAKINPKIAFYVSRGYYIISILQNISNIEFSTPG